MFGTNICVSIPTRITFYPAEFIICGCRLYNCCLCCKFLSGHLCKGNFNVKYMYNKKTAYALKTPHIVFLPVIYLNSFFGMSQDDRVRVTMLSEVNGTFPWTFFDLVTLTYDLGLLTWPRYPSTWPPCQNSSPYVRLVECDGHIHRRCQNYYTHHVRDVGWNKNAFCWMRYAKSWV